MASPVGGFSTLPYTMTPQQMAQFQQQLTQYGGGNPTVSPTGAANNTGAGGDWSWLAPFLTGIGSLATANTSNNYGREAAGMADPFSGERGQYMRGLHDYMTANPVNPGQVTAGSNNALAQLTNLIQNPGSLTTMPGYQFGLNQALEGVNRGAGASGLLNSGNRLAALEDRGNSYAQSWQNQIFNQLLGNVKANNDVAQLGLSAQGQGYNELQHLAGADTGNPTAAAQALLNGNQARTNSIGSGIGAFANAAPGMVAAFQRWMNSGGSGPGWNGATPGAANGEWDNIPGINPGSANGEWDNIPGISLGGGGEEFIDLASYL